MKKILISLIMMAVALCLSSCQKVEEFPTIEGEWEVSHLISNIVYSNGETAKFNQLSHGFITDMSFVFDKNGSGDLRFTKHQTDGEIKEYEMGFVYETDGNKMIITEGGYAHHAEFTLDNDTLVIELEGPKLFRKCFGDLLDCDFTIRMKREM